MRKFIMGLLGMCLAGLFVVAVQESASATTTSCRESSDQAVKYCIQYSMDPGSDGFYVYWVRASCRPFWFGVNPPFGWDDVAVDGHGIQVQNADPNPNVIKWSVDDSNSNVHIDSGGEDVCTRTWWVQEHYPGMNTLYTVYWFTEQKNNQSDVSDSIDMKITNAG